MTLVILQKPSTPKGLTGEYFANSDLTAHRETILADPDEGLMPMPSTSPSDGWSGRWSGKFRAKMIGGGHRFSATTPVGTVISIRVNQKLAFSRNAAGVVSSSNVTIPAGAEVDFQVDAHFPNDAQGVYLRYQPPTEVNQPLLSEFLKPTIIPKAPEEPIALGTAADRIALYADDVPDALGFYVIRSASQGQSSIGTLLNTSPHRSKSYPTAKQFFYSDTGRVPGVMQYYALKTAYMNPVTGLQILSSPSQEVEGFADAEGIPYDSLNSGLVLAALAEVSYDQIDTSLPFVASGPDGAIFSNLGGSLSPEATVGGNGTVTYPDGNSTPLTTGAQSNDFASSTGPLQRRVTTPGFSAIQGTFILPTENNVQMNSINIGNPPSSTADHAFLYLGSTAIVTQANPRYEVQVDAGLQYNNSKQVWEPIITAAKTDSLGARPPSFVWRSNLPSFSPTSSVSLEFFSQRPTSTEVSSTSVKQKNVFLRCYDAINDVTAQLSDFVRAQPSSRAVLRMKCVHSIGQRLPANTSQFTIGYARSRSKFLGSIFQSGQVRETRGTTALDFRVRVDNTGAQLNGALLTQAYPAGIVQVTGGTQFSPAQTVNINLE